MLESFLFSQFISCIHFAYLKKKSFWFNKKKTLTLHRILAQVKIPETAIEKEGDSIFSFGNSIPTNYCPINYIIIGY